MFNDPSGAQTRPEQLKQIRDGMFKDVLGKSNPGSFFNNDSYRPGGDKGFDYRGERGGAFYAIAGGWSFEGSAIDGFLAAYNNPNANGDWSFSFGRDKHGDMGYWSSFSFDPGNRGDGHVNLDGVGVGTRFVQTGSGGGSQGSGSNGIGGFGTLMLPGGNGGGGESESPLLRLRWCSA